MVAGFRFFAFKAEDVSLNQHLVSGSKFQKLGSAAPQVRWKLTSWVRDVANFHCAPHFTESRQLYAYLRQCRFTADLQEGCVD